MLTRPWTLLCLLATLTALAVLIPRIIQEASDLVATPPSPALDATTSPDPLAWFCIALVVFAARACLVTLQGLLGQGEVP